MKGSEAPALPRFMAVCPLLILVLLVNVMIEQCDVFFAH